MQTQPSVIATGDFLYFAPAGQAFTVPSAGTVGPAAKPGATDAIWTTFALGTVKKPATVKKTAKETMIKAPLPNSGMIATTNVLRSELGFVMDIEMNEISRLALAGFYQSGLIALNATSFYPLAGIANFLGWLKIQRFDASLATGTPWLVEDWWVDLNVTDIAVGENNVIQPKFAATWLYSALAGAAC